MEQNVGYPEETRSNAAAWIIPGVAIGAAIGIAYAATRRKKTRWDEAKEWGERIYDKRESIVDTGRNLFERIQHVIDEGRKIVEEAAELWSHGRKLVARH